MSLKPLINARIVREATKKIASQAKAAAGTTSSVTDASFSGSDPSQSIKVSTDLTVGCRKRLRSTRCLIEVRMKSHLQLN